MPRQLHRRHISQSFATLPKPPCVNDKVDVFWPECERYFRGTLVERAQRSPFQFYIHYEDDDYLKTDLNTTRWHYARGSYSSPRACCDEGQETLRDDDSMPGDLQDYSSTKSRAALRGRGTAATTQSATASGRVGKRRKHSTRQARNSSDSSLEYACDDMQMVEKIVDGKVSGSDYAPIILSDSLTEMHCSGQSEETSWKPEAFSGDANVRKDKRSGQRCEKLVACTLESVSERWVPRRRRAPAKAHWKKLVLDEYCSRQV